MLTVTGIVDNDVLIEFGQGLRQRVTVLRAGRVGGPRLAGRVRSGGSEWMTVTEEGAVHLDGRLVLEAADGAVVTMGFSGRACGPAPARPGLDRAAFTFRIRAEFRTSAASLAWLNAVVATGLAHPWRAAPPASIGLAPGPVYELFEAC